MNLRKDIRGALTPDRIIGLVVVVIIGLAMAPVVDDFTEDYKDGDNADDASDDVTGARATLADLIPLFYIIGIVLAAISMAMAWKGGK